MAAEVLVSPIVDLLLGKLSSQAYQQFSFIYGVKKDLKKLQRTLNTIKAVLLDAEEQQLHNRQVGFWLEELKDVCYDAENVFDAFQAEALRRQVLAERGSIPKKVGNALSWPKSLAFRFNIGYKIKELRERLDEIASNQTKFGFTNRVENAINVRRQRETHSFVVASEIIGREKDKEEIIELLMDSPDDKNVSVIPIVGIAGLGKTALAKLVYNDNMIDEFFDLKLWICVSDDFVEEKIMRDIIKSGGRNHNDMSLDQLQKEMRDILDEYLVEDIGNLKALRSLFINNCPNLVSLPSSIKCLSSLEELYLGDCEKLNLNWGMGMEEEDTHQDLNGTRPHLRDLYLEKLLQLVELPQWLLRCSANTLQWLRIRECPYLLALPDSLQNLKSLQVWDCPKVASLPQDMHGLTTLETIEIEGCPTLSERCDQGSGEDWPQIAHVPNIYLDGYLISSNYQERRAPWYFLSKLNQTSDDRNLQRRRSCHLSTVANIIQGENKTWRKRKNMAESSLDYSSQFDHTPFYCEENVYFLCKKLCANGVADADGTDLYVVFISNEKKQAYPTMPQWHQKASKRADGVILWDYHAVCIQLLMCLKPSDHLFSSFLNFRGFSESCMLQYSSVFSPLIGRHMKDPAGNWIAEPPSYEPIVA
ncbi:hypothetical protein LWI29_029017 [Acer saccharum]|uniref:Protein N-terminal glutamine amidohydrolase n=1 Tax=Acer saccharum TaxID=4024 RepID=A0AA39SRL2_ACESA|nr:hypothetical protein LWI29_029017 [Acer saccharum]